MRSILFEHSLLNLNLRSFLSHASKFVCFIGLKDLIFVAQNEIRPHCTSSLSSSSFPLVSHECCLKALSISWLNPLRLTWFLFVTHSVAITSWTETRRRRQQQQEQFLPCHGWRTNTRIYWSVRQEDVDTRKIVTRHWNRMIMVVYCRAVPPRIIWPNRSYHRAPLTPPIALPKSGLPTEVGFNKDNVIWRILQTVVI